MPAIAFILESFYGDHIGGSERQVQMLGEALRNHGWRTFYICERTLDKPRFENFQGIEALALPVRKKRSTWLNYRALKTAMIESQADLFYQRVRHPYSGMVEKIARKLKKPFVWAAASTADVIRNKDLRQASYSFSLLTALMHPLNRYMEDKGILKADAVVLQAKEQLRLLQEEYHRDGVVIPNHIVVRDHPAVEKANPPEVLWLSNIKPFKQPEIFIDLAERCSDLEARFVMAGACPDAVMLGRIRQAEQRLQHFSYVGPLDPAVSEKRIAAASVLVNTSLFEGFPNAFQQAWSNGVPTLSLNVDPDGVIAREGLGSCTGTVEKLEDELRLVLADSEKRRSIGDRAKTFACRTYDLSRILPQYLSLFEGLLRR